MVMVIQLYRVVEVHQTTSKKDNLLYVNLSTKYSVPVEILVFDTQRNVRHKILIINPKVVNGCLESSFK